MALGPISQKTLADTVEIRLREFIRESGLTPGDALPGEQALASQLQVSRNVIREALSRLRMQGLVQSRKRRGMVVASPEHLFAGLDRLLQTGILDDKRAQDLAQLRVVIELGIADFVVAGLTDERLEDLARIAEELEASTDMDRRRELDHAFHAILYHLTGNRELVAFQSLLMLYFQHLVVAKPSGPTSIPGGTHTDLVHALHARDPKAFRNVMRIHLKNQIDHLREMQQSRARAHAAHPDDADTESEREP